MIQRKQTLFLFLLGALNAALLFIPSVKVVMNGNTFPVVLEPLKNSELISTIGHTTAIFLNFASLVLAFLTVFIYNKRELQIKLCYALAGLWLVLSGMILFCPFITKTESISAVNVNYVAVAIGFIAVAIAFVAAKFIKKDIDLLKSADRIR
ncbi:MAG: DUF4293 family protein [Bacteroidia bacterium]|nr:DUF4293 family protein [Bacteroidia bacterium]